MIRWLSIGLGVVAGLALAASCTGKVETSGSGGTGTGGTGTGGSGGHGNAAGSGGQGGVAACFHAGDCQTNADCAPESCIAVTDCVKECGEAFVEATTCANPADECCTSATCDPGEVCYTGPFGAFCGGAFPPSNNRCLADECTTDASCGGAGQVCAPAGTFHYPVRHCVAAACKTSADCTAEPGGECAPATTACCSHPNALYCIYPSDGCLSSADCGSDFCVDDNGRARCSANFPGCPP